MRVRAMLFDLYNLPQFGLAISKKALLTTVINSKIDFGQILSPKRTRCLSLAANCGLVLIGTE